MYKNKTLRAIFVHVPWKTRTHAAKVGAGDWVTADAGTEGGAALVCVAYKGKSSIIWIILRKLNKNKDIINQSVIDKQEILLQNRIFTFIIRLSKDNSN